MKKSLAMMLALIMVCALPGIASANSGGSINGAGITQNAVSIELEDITFADSVKVELFSDKTLLTTATLNEKALEANTNYDYVTCCIPTVGEDKAWSLTPWIPRDKIVPNIAVLFVDGNKLDTKKLTLDAKAWADLPGTVPYSGSINGACITQNAVSIELEDITFEKSVQVKLFSGETLLTTATLNEKALEANTYYQFVTCCIPTEGADDKAWSLTPWIPRDNIIPTKAVLFVDDHEMNTKEFKLDAKAWADLPGTVPYSGSIERAGITHANGGLKNAVSVDLKNVNFGTSVQVKLYSGETLLTTATLNTDKLGAGSYPYLTCCIATQTADEYWSLTPWTPKDDVVPTKAVLFVDGEKLHTKEFTLNAKEWADLPGTASPDNGGTTGGGSYWHPPVTPAPVPVVVIPPKTGDMTIWQSILHFFGVI